MNLDWAMVATATISVWVLVGPLSRGVFFRMLTEGKSKTGGRNGQGRITTRHIGGGHKQTYRRIDFKRDKDGVPGRVRSLEYDPNRSASDYYLTWSRDGGDTWSADMRISADSTSGESRPLRLPPRGV